MSTQRKTGVDRRRQIVEVATDLLDRMGPRMSTHAIAAEIGISQPAIFRHFPNKDAIYEEIVVYVSERIMERLGAAMERTRPGLDRLVGTVEEYMALMQEIPALPAVYYSRQFHHGNAAFLAAIQGRLQFFQGLLAEMIQDAKDAGEIATTVTADEIAEIVLDLILGLGARWSISDQRFDLRQRGRKDVTLLLSGLGGAAA